MKITLDAGHNQASNISPVNKKYIEGVQMYKLAGYLKTELEKYGIEVALTRSRLTDNPTLSQRGRMAGSNGSDVFISLHSNAPAPNKAGEYDTSITGTCIYYSLTQPANKTLADKLGAAISSAMGHKYRGSLTRSYPDNPKRDYYGVIRAAAESGCKSAYLIEHGFHTCPKDIAFLLSDDKLKQLAKAEAEVIAQQLGIAKLYRVQIGSFRSKTAAEVYAGMAKADGYPAFVTQSE